MIVGMVACRGRSRAAFDFAVLWATIPCRGLLPNLFSGALMTSNDAIAHSLTISGTMLDRYTADLTPQEYLHRPCGDANCAAWLVGHLILSERNAMKRLGVTDLPELPEGFEKRFARDPEAPKASDFG